MRVDQSPIFTEDGTALYRFAYLAAKELLATVQEWRNTIEGSRPADYSRARDELKALLRHLESWLCPPVRDGEPIDPRDTPDWRDLPGVSQLNLREEFVQTRNAVCSGLGFSALCAHEVVCELAFETIRAVTMLAATKDRATLDFLLGPKSPLRLSGGLGPIDQKDAERLEAECLQEAEEAWRASRPGKKTKETAPVASKEASPVAASVCVKLYGLNDSPIVNGKKKRRLTRARYDLVLALVEAGENGLTGDELVKASGHGDSVKTMKRLADSDTDWEAVLVFPVTNYSGGYRIK